MKSEAKKVQIDPETLETAIREAFPEMYARHDVPGWVADTVHRLAERDFAKSIDNLRRSHEYCLDRAASWFPVGFIRWEGYASPGTEMIFDDEGEAHSLDAQGHLVGRGQDRVLLRDQGRDLAVEVLIHREADALDVITLLEKILADIRRRTEELPAPEPERAEDPPRRLGPFAAWRVQSPDVPF